MIMNPNPKKPIIISIAMATFNGEKYLKDQLQSFINQTRPPDELVVCDDHSSDKTIDILRDFAATAPFSFKVVCNELNLGAIPRTLKKLSVFAPGILFFSAIKMMFGFPKKFHPKPAIYKNIPSASW